MKETEKLELSISLFLPEEHVLFASWFGITPPKTFSETFEDSIEERGVKRLYVITDERDDDTDYGLLNAVARILLEAVENRLPHMYRRLWLKNQMSGTEEKPARKIRLLPTKLFEVHWASPSPGYSGLEAYYLCYVPHYNVYVVTLSHHSPRIHGYCDIALGWFNTELDIFKGAKKIVQNHWRRQLNWGQPRWKRVWSEGLITASEAKQWADVIWGANKRNENNRTTILVVEDDQHFLYMLLYMLQNRGYDVAFAKDGDSGWNIYKKTKPDLVFINHEIPEMNGLELLDKIKDDDPLAPVIIQATNTSIRDESFHHGADDFLEKIFSEEELFLSIEKVLHPNRLLQDD